MINRKKVHLKGQRLIWYIPDNKQICVNWSIGVAQSCYWFLLPKRELLG